MPIAHTRRSCVSAVVLTAAAACLSINLAAPAAAQTDLLEVGVWLDDTGDGAVEIYPCGDRLCGRIVWLKNPINSQGKPLHDAYNPDAALRSRPICGLPMLRDLRRMNDGSWDFGTVYDPKKGSQHEAAIKLLRPDRLQLTGFGLGRLLSKSFIWTRAPAELELCTAPAGQAKQGAAPAAKPNGAAGVKQKASDPAKAKATAPKEKSGGTAAAKTDVPVKKKAAATEGAGAAQPVKAKSPDKPAAKSKTIEAEAGMGVLSRPAP